MSSAATIICPKCGGDMRTYERSGVQLDQCTECRGIFLDRGELEQLIDASGVDGRRERGSVDHDMERHDRDDRDDRRRGHDSDEDRRGRRRSSPASMLSDLLGGGGE